MLLDKAVEVTGKSIRTLKRYIKQGKLKGRQAGKNVNSPLQVWISEKSLLSNDDDDSDENIDDPEILDAESNEVDFSPEADEPVNENVDKSDPVNPYQSAIQTMAMEFTKVVQQQQEEFVKLRAELQDKEVQLRLLPDLQKKEEQAHLEKSALQKQVEALQASVEAKENSVQELEAQIEKMRLEAEAASQKKRSVWDWFIGKNAK